METIKMFDRARDARRVAKSIRTHESTMDAFGKASIKNPDIFRGHITEEDRDGKTINIIDSNPSRY
jgi:hypothetical protein